MWKTLALAALCSAASGAAPADHPAAWTVATIPWQTVAANGTKFALLEGRRDAAGVAFSYAFHIPAAVWDGSHSHSATTRVFVARGTLRIGYGATTDKRLAKSCPVGSYMVVPAGAIHFDGPDEDAVIIGTATGR